MIEKRLGILPFETDHPRLQYLAESIQDLLIADFSRLLAFQVISKESAQIALQEESLEKVSQKLDVLYLVAGQLEEKEGVQATIRLYNSQLPESQEKTILVPKNSLFELGGKCLEITYELLDLAKESIASIEVEKIQNPETYREFLLAGFHFNRWTPDDVSEAIGLYKSVIEKEPHFVPAYLKLAKAYIFQAGRGYLIPGKVYPKAREAIQKALEINPNSGEAIIDKNLIDFFFDLNWSNIYRSIEKGLSNYVDASEAYQQLSFFWYGLKEYDAALDALYSALEYDPLSTGILNMIGDVQLSAQRFDDAERTFKSILKYHQNDISSLENLLYIACLRSRNREAEVYIHKIERILGTSKQFLARLGYAYAKFGYTDKVDEYLKYYDAVARNQTHTITYNFQANIYAGLREWDKAMDCIEKGWNARTGILYILTDPQLEPLRRKARYKKLVSQIIFPILEEDTNYITLGTDIKETYRINLNALLYAKGEDNYTRLFFYQNFRIENKLIRATLKKVENQLPSERFIRVQKAFVFNCEQEFSMQGNSRTRTIFSTKYDYSIPVSRSLGNEALELLKSRSIKE